MTTSEIDRRALEHDNRTHLAICDWIREDAPLTVKMCVMPEHVAALVTRLAKVRAPAPAPGGTCENHYDPSKIITDEATARKTITAPVPGGGASETDGRFWLELREPRRVPERKGSWPMPIMAKILREVMAARPNAYITVVTVDEDGPHFDDGPQTLQMADARSMSTGSRHMRSTDAAHAGLRGVSLDPPRPSGPADHEEVVRRGETGGSGVEGED